MDGPSKGKKKEIPKKTARKLLSSDDDGDISLHDSSNYGTDEEAMIRKIEIINKKNKQKKTFLQAELDEIYSETEDDEAPDDDLGTEVKGAGATEAKTK